MYSEVWAQAQWPKTKKITKVISEKCLLLYFRMQKQGFYSGGFVIALIIDFLFFFWQSILSCHLTPSTATRARVLLVATWRKCGSAWNQYPTGLEWNGTAMSKGLNFWSKSQRCVPFFWWEGVSWWFCMILYELTQFSLSKVVPFLFSSINNWLNHF